MRSMTSTGRHPLKWVASVAVLAEQLGFAPIALGPLKDGGSLVQARGNTWAELIFQDLVKFK